MATISFPPALAAGKIQFHLDIRRKNPMRFLKSIPAPKIFSLILGLLIVPLLASPAPMLSQVRTVNATIDVSKTGAPISKNIYGQFLEHGGDIVNTGVWSEMLIDRKFFYPVAASAPTPPPVMGNAAGNPRFRRTPTRWWAPIGGDKVVIMDTKKSHNSAHFLPAHHRSSTPTYTHH